MNYNFLLTCHEAETNDEVGHIEATSLESLQEQLHKLESAIKEYEELEELDEGICPDCETEALDEKDERCPECEAVRAESRRE